MSYRFFDEDDAVYEVEYWFMPKYSEYGRWLTGTMQPMFCYERKKVKRWKRVGEMYDILNADGFILWRTGCIENKNIGYSIAVYKFMFRRL